MRPEIGAHTAANARALIVGATVGVVAFGAVGACTLDTSGKHACNSDVDCSAGHNCVDRRCTPGVGDGGTAAQGRCPFPILDSPALAPGLPDGGPRPRAPTMLGIWSPSNGLWSTYDQRTQGPVQPGVHFGGPGDRFLPGDYDGDGVYDLAVWHAATQTCSAQRLDGSSIFEDVVFGQPDDLFLPGDYNGDGITDLSVWRPSDQSWSVFDVKKGTFFIEALRYGNLGDVFLPADYNGNGSTDFSVWRPSEELWYAEDVLTSEPIWTIGVSFGKRGDVFLPGDYNGDGIADFAVWRPQTQLWYGYDAHNGLTISSGSRFGLTGDVFLPGDYDGDGTTDLALWRPQSQSWIIASMLTGACLFPDIHLGGVGDRLLPGPRALCNLATSSASVQVATCGRANLSGGPP